MPKPPVTTRPCHHCDGTGIEMDPVAFGAVMRQLREKAGLSLREVADRMGKSAPYVSDMERGHRAFTQKMIAAFTKATAGK